VAGATRDVLRRIDPDLPLIQPSAMEDVIQRSIGQQTLLMTLLGLFAAFAMLLAVVGTYSVLAYIVSQRRNEIGVRLALGATADDIGRRVLLATARHVVLGLALGLPAAWWISRGFGALFFQVRPSDLTSYALVAAVIVLAALAAAIVPARRASRVDPLVSLRSA